MLGQDAGSDKDPDELVTALQAELQARPQASFGVTLAHAYAAPRGSLTPDKLKGKDAGLYQLLQPYFHLELCPVEITRHMFGYDDEGEESDICDEGEPENNDYRLLGSAAQPKHWLNIPDTEKVPLVAKDVMPIGNEGCEVDMKYHAMALVIRKERKAEKGAQGTKRKLT
ncbi:hypothetical protein WJX72_009305 [[Myrmecia] bisecta]|uniref:Uncharacterized protein n=1 Tax=[Myrmecia] bisecta TaxID=41462 RepID=A0AAW1Q3P2_9CHLO